MTRPTLAEYKELAQVKNQKRLKVQDHMSRVMHCEINNFHFYDADNPSLGFSFTVKEESDAYKCAYKYRNSERSVLVEKANLHFGWFVSVKKDAC